jgi:hypothetical protein
MWRGSACWTQRLPDLPVRGLSPRVHAREGSAPALQRGSAEALSFEPPQWMRHSSAAASASASRSADPLAAAGAVQTALRAAVLDRGLGHDARAQVLAALHAWPVLFDLVAAPARIVFRPDPEAPGWWIVGREGAERRLQAPSIGVAIAYAALAGESPLCARFVPSGGNAAGLVRRAVRDTAAKWAEHVARCPELAGAMRAMRVLGDPPRVEYAQRMSAPVFVLCPSARQDACTA